MDNENIRLKDDLRREFSDSAKALRVIHSSDNALEALEHLHHLGLNPEQLLPAAQSGKRSGHLGR